MAVDYSNSSLVNYTKISPNKNTTRVHNVYNPTGKITKITVHHMAGNLSLETCGNGFANVSRQASSNYGIDSNGRIALYVDEKHRSWASSSPDNDYKAVTIEVANDGNASTNWHVSDKAYAALIDLCVDICKRNGIAKLNYTNDATGNLTRHNMFTATTCPGGYLQSKFDDIAKQVNERLSPTCTGKITGYNVTRWTNYLVIYNKGNNTGTNEWGTEVAVNSDGVATCTPVYGKGKMEIPVGGYVISGHGVASDWIKKNIKKGSKITISNDVIKVGAVVSVTSSSVKISVGDTVNLVDGAKYTSGTSVPSWLLKSVLYVREIRNNGNVVISTLKTGAITGVVNSKYLTKNGKSVTTANATNISTIVKLSVGDKVKLVSGAKYTNGRAIPVWVLNSTLYLREIQGNNAVISTLRTGAITGVVALSDLKKI